MIHIDLHTHSVASPDGGITATVYKQVIEANQLDYVAVTDHNTIDFAVELQGKLGDRIIIGEEIMTLDGEVIGLYLQKTIAPNLGLQETIQEIKQQGGLVYIPHPFEKTRKGISITTLASVAQDVDIIETVNGRAFAENHTKRVQQFATEHSLATCGSSDAHGAAGWGRTYTTIAEAPTKDSLPALLLTAEITYKKPSLQVLLYPKYNRIRKKFL